MKKAILIILLSIFPLLFNSCKTLAPPLSGREFINMKLQPTSIYNYYGGSFTVSATADWTGDDDSPLRIVITRNGDYCNAYFNEDGDRIKKGEEFTKSISTSEFEPDCRGSGYTYTVTLIVWNSNPEQRATAELSWNGQVSVLSAYVEKGRMQYVEDFSVSDMNDAIGSARNTFRNPNADSWVQIINQGTNGETYPHQDFIGQPTQYDMERTIFDYVHGTPQTPGIHINPANYPYLLVFGNVATYNQIPEHAYYLGASMNVNNPIPEYQDWDDDFSVVFVQSIRNFCEDPIPPQSEFVSVLNQTTPHELIHQLGNTWDHANHSSDENNCVLNYATHFYEHTQYFTQTTTRYAICIDHIYDLRNELRTNAISNIVHKSVVFDLSNSQYSRNDSKLQIELPKQKYKKFEPINLIAKWINNTNNIDSIWTIFSESTDDIKIIISGENGEVFNKKNKLLNSHIIYKEPQYIVLPKDTLTRTIKINNYGKPISSVKNMYFGNIGYLPPGKYAVQIIIGSDNGREYELPVESNELNFEIVDLDPEDTNILNLVSEYRFSDAINNYSSGDFEEHIRYHELQQYIGAYLNAKFKKENYIDVSVLTEKFIQFFNLYPNSLYNLSDIFLYNYLSINDNNFDSILRKSYELSRIYSGTIIEKIINDMNKRSKIQKIYESKK